MKLKDYFLKEQAAVKEKINAGELTTKDGLFYRKIAAKCKPTMHESQVCYVIQKPFRVSLATFLAVAKVLGMPEEEAKVEWADIKWREVKKRIVSDVASGRSRNYSVYKKKK